MTYYEEGTTALDPLIGKKVLAVNFDHDIKDLIQFETDGGTYTYFTEGDCCSSSFFTDINGVQALIGHIVTSIEQVNLPDPEKLKPQDEDLGDHNVVKAYGYKLKTTGGYVNFVFHNISNGYYEGSLESLDNEYYANHNYMQEYYKDRVLTPLTEDF